MYTFEWKPKAKEVPKIKEDGSFEIVDGKPVIVSKEPVFSGYVKVKVPKHFDRINVIKSIRNKINSNGELVEASNMESAEILMEFAKKQIDQVNLVRIDDSLEVKTVEWLEYDIDGAEVLSDISTVLVQGVKLGKS